MSNITQNISNKNKNREIAGRKSTLDNTEINQIKQENVQYFILFLMNQAFGYRSVDDKFVESNDKIYKIIKSYSFVIFGTLVCIAQFMVSWLEPRSVIFPPIQYNSDNKAPLNLTVSNVLDLLCVICHNLSLYLHKEGCGVIRRRLKFFWVLCGVSYLGILCSFIVPKGFRLHRVSRPYYIFIYYNELRWWFYLIIRCPLSFILSAPFYIVSLFIVSMVVFGIYSPKALQYFPQMDKAEPVPEFKSLMSTYHWMIWFQLGVTQPNQWGSIAYQNEFHAYFWVVLQVLLFLFLHNIALTFIIENYEECVTHDFEKTVSVAKLKLEQTWEVLKRYKVIKSDDTGMNKDTFLYLMKNYYLHQDRNNTDLMVKVFWGLINDQTGSLDILTKTEWLRLTEIAFLQWDLIPLNKPKTLFESIVSYKITLFNQNVVIIDLIYIVLTVLQCIIIISALDKTEADPFWAKATCLGINLFHLLHMIISILGEGPTKYFKSIHVIDFVVTMLTIIILLKWRNFMNHIGMKDSIQLFRLFTVAYFIGKNIQRLKRTADAITVALKMVFKSVFVVFAFQIMWALIGMEIHGNIREYIDKDKEPEIQDHWTGGLGGEHPEALVAQNYDSLYRAIPLMYIYLCENGADAWNFWYLQLYEKCASKCGSFLEKHGPTISGVFGLSMYCSVILVCGNILVAVFMDGFMGTYNKDEKGRLKQIQFHEQINKQIKKLNITDFIAYVNAGTKDSNFGCIDDELEILHVPYWND